jgi:hypothetical protein
MQGVEPLRRVQAWELSVLTKPGDELLLPWQVREGVRLGPHLDERETALLLAQIRRLHYKNPALLEEIRRLPGAPPFIRRAVGD